MDTLRKLQFILCLCVALVSSCKPSYPPPPGFVEACYGGDVSKTLDGATPRFRMQLPASPDQWSDIARRFQDFGASHELKYFDTSVSDIDGLKMINVHLCSAKGIWLSADKRLWSGRSEPSPNVVPIDLYQYDTEMDWVLIAAELEKSFQDWPGGFQSQRPGSR